MKKHLKIFYLLSVMTCSALFAEENTQASSPAETAQSVDIAKVSEAFGHVIGKNLENIGINFDKDQIVKGLQDSLNGKNAPMSEMECIQAIASVQEKAFKELCAENLKKADSFLAENAKQEGIVSLEEGKVQYLISEKGKGAEVEPHFSPLVRFTGKCLDGTVFLDSKEDEMVFLDETLPGLKAGLIGMREGEKRKIYIHPDFALDLKAPLRNSLLTFDVEVIKANAPTKVADDTNLGQPETKHEVADLKTDLR